MCVCVCACVFFMKLAKHRNGNGGAHRTYPSHSLLYIIILFHAILSRALSLSLSLSLSPRLFPVNPLPPKHPPNNNPVIQTRGQIPSGDLRGVVAGCEEPVGGWSDVAG